MRTLYIVLGLAVLALIPAISASNCEKCDKATSTLTVTENTSEILQSSVQSAFVGSNSFRCYTCLKKVCLRAKKGQCISWGARVGTCCT